MAIAMMGRWLALQGRKGAVKRDADTAMAVWLWSAAISSKKSPLPRHGGGLLTQRLAGQDGLRASGQRIKRRLPEICSAGHINGYFRT
ncbi:hypothetical protein [Mesorhizobium sp. LjNodule214]|uniref:hypothetical protein n=1 Tax=Mesorhizobium sp. LjNodule214 TaxID=3342252 RepID=UPI003ECC21D9